MKAPDSKFRYYIWVLSESTYLDSFIMLCIVSNIITMAMSYETSVPEYDNVLNNINLAFTVVFIVEFLIKIIAYGAQGYFYKGWNQFDFSVVCVSIIDIIMDFSGK